MKGTAVFWNVANYSTNDSTSHPKWLSATLLWDPKHPRESNRDNIQGKHKRMVGFKESTEENLVTEKEYNTFYFTRKT